MADCIDARITASIKTALEGITVANGYNTEIGTVQEKRSIFVYPPDNEEFTVIELITPDIEQDYQHTEDGIYKCMIYYHNGKDDTDPSSIPIQYQNRNVAADIQKALMVDRTRGNIAQNTHVYPMGHSYFFMQAQIDIPLVCTGVMVDVDRIINVDNPYEIG